MEETKLSGLITQFDFVVGGMKQVDKTWDNFIKLHTYYTKNKASIVKHSNYRIIIGGVEFNIAQKIVEAPVKKYDFNIILLAAMDNNNLIGIGDLIPWRLSVDMKKFKETTTGRIIIMGRKTFETFPKPLPNRTHYIITRDKDYAFPDGIDYTNCYIFHSVDEALDFVSSSTKKVYVIGGGEIYKQTIDIADELDITRVMTKIPLKWIDETTTETPIVFPFIDFNKWRIDKNSLGFKDEKNEYDYMFRNYIRILNPIEDEVKLTSPIIKKLIISHALNNLK